MRKYFTEKDKLDIEKNMKPSKYRGIDILNDLNYEDIKDCLEDVDANGEEQGENKKYKEIMASIGEVVEEDNDEKDTSTSGQTGGQDLKKKKHKKKKK